MTGDSSPAIDPVSPTGLQLLFHRHGFRPRRHLGQTFLIDRNIVHKIVGAAELRGEEPVLEVGAGAGAVTRVLTKRGRRVVAVEIDSVLVGILREMLGEEAEVVEADLLELEWVDLLGADKDGQWHVVANLPYAITGPAILKLLDGAGWFRRMVLLVQQEVADRLLAAPGSRSRGLLTVLVEAAAAATLIGKVTRTCFLPQPRVDSAILALDVRRSRALPPGLEDMFRRVVKAAFSMRRKTLVNSLSRARGLRLSKEEAAEVLSQCGIDPRRRAETLSVQEFVLLAKAVQAGREGTH